MRPGAAFERGSGPRLRLSRLSFLRSVALDALARFDDALNLLPRNAEVHVNRGNVLQDLEASGRPCRATLRRLPWLPNTSERSTPAALPCAGLGCT